MATTSIDTFGDLLRRHRITAGLSQEALAERAGLSARGISDLERGVNRAPQRETLLLLADALALSPDERGAFETLARRRAITAPPSASTRPPTGLPRPLTPLIGREREVAALSDLLSRDEVRLLTLTGPGGVGKTRLAIQVATTLSDQFPDGTVFVALAALRDPTLLILAIAQSVGIVQTSGGSFHDTLVAYLRGRRTLLVLDNAEHLLAGVPLLAELLVHCESLTMLVTSRAALRLRGEREYAVPPLALPDAALISAAAIGAAPAVALFVRRAQDSAPSFALTPANAVNVAAICARLDGLPLAIELAAARIKLLTPRALLTRLERRLDVLTAGPRDLPERQQTMRDTIAWSYDLLNAAEQALFRRLAVFVGGCTLEAAEQVCQVGGDLHGAALDWLASLVEKSLLRRQGDDDEPRVGMLETIREYGLERLAASGETPALRRRHATYLLALVEEAEPALTGPRQAAWLDRLEREHDNVRAALRWAEESGEIELGLRLAAALWRFWGMRGHGTEGRRWLDELLEYDASSGGAALRARVLTAAGALAREQNDFARAQALHEQSLALRRTLDDHPGIAAALNSLGNVAREQGEYPRAADYYEQSLALNRELGNERGCAGVLGNLGSVAQELGEYDRALALQEESLALYRRLNDAHGSAITLSNMGLIARQLGDLQRAQELLERSLALRRELGDRRGLAITTTNLAGVVRVQGNLQRATQLYAEGLALFDSLGDRRIAASSLAGLAAIASARGEQMRAARLFGACEALRQSANLALPLSDREEYERDVASVRAALPDDAFAVAWAEGAALSLNDAIAYALME